MADTYILTISHSSISRAPEVEFRGSLVAAKRAATAWFGDGFRDHEIVIVRFADGQVGGDVVARRRISDRRWRA